MSAPARIAQSVYILVPHVGVDNRDAVLLGRGACRVADQMGLLPVFPFLWACGYLTEEEMDRRLAAHSWKWFKRITRIWLCSPDEHPSLDPLSHDILLRNEGLLLSKIRGGRASLVFASRVPVYWYRPGYDGESVKVQAIERSDIACTLRRNITSGLFRGVAI